jgi:hypothetical protein
MAPVVTPVETNTSKGIACFKCGEVGHYANVYPKRNAPNRATRETEQCTWQSEPRECRDCSGEPMIVFSMSLVNFAPASVLFDAGATHSFITSQCAAKLNIPMNTMPRPMLVSSTRGNMKALYKCNNVNLQILGKDFQADPIVLDSIGIDVVLGMGWLGKFNGEI